MQKEPEFVMFVGLPGSGKSTYANELEKRGYIICSSDAIRKELFGNLYQGNAGLVFDTLHSRVIDCLKNGIPCVYDATNVSAGTRKSFLKKIADIPCKKTALVVVTPVDVVRDRNTKRGEANVPMEAIDRMLRNFQTPTYEEGWDDIKIVSGCDKAKDGASKDLDEIIKEGKVQAAIFAAKQQAEKETASRNTAGRAEEMQNQPR